MKIDYTGNLRTRITHDPSGHTVETDAPLDNQGLAQRISPTDLVASALGSCMLTIMGIKARDHGFSMEGAGVTVIKTMADKPRRIAQLDLEVRLPGKDWTPTIKRFMERIARHCPVHRSINPNIQVNLNFVYF